MLTHLAIRDFTIVDRLDLELEAGLTAMTGETGAGKSILVDALMLVLGGRASPDVVRPGQTRAEITAMFDLSHAPELGRRLERLELESEDGECIFRRVIGAEGRSRAFVNGRPVPVQTLRDLTQGVVEVHGQHAHHSLLRSECQRQLLDALGDHGQELSAVTDAHGDLTRLEGEREALLAAFDDRETRADYLRFQLEELEAANLSACEADALGAEQRRLANAQELVAACAQLGSALGAHDGRDDAMEAIRESLARSQQLAALDPVFDEIARCLNNALIELEEAGRTVRSYSEALELSPHRLQEVEARLAQLHDLARKHRVGVKELSRREEELRCEVERLTSVDEKLQILESQLALVRARYDDTASVLHERRQRSARPLGKSVSDLLSGLGMPKAEFSVTVAAIMESRSEPVRTAHGRDRIEFWVRANAGHEPTPLARTASGGELSRISLALQVAAASTTGSSTLVFDEVDVGVGGAVAEQVGRRLREVAASKQVLCITHLPQVAVQAAHHLRVQKREADNATFTDLEIIRGKDRVEEIARMLGGIEITSRTLAHAREMLATETST